MDHHAIIIEDDPVTAKLIGQMINQPIKSFESITAFNSEADKLSPTCIFIDIHLGMHESGLDLIPGIRRRWPQVPILVITGNTAQDSVKLALEAGANDFLTKPLNVFEVKARLQTRLLECSHSSKKELVTFKDISLDFRYNTLQCGTKRVFLSVKEINLLKLLVDANGVIVSRQTIMSEVWGKLRVTDNCIDRKIFEVRHALEEVGSSIHILSVYGKGVTLSYDGESNQTLLSDEMPRSPKSLSSGLDFKNLVHIDINLLRKISALDENEDNDFILDIVTTFETSTAQVLKTIENAVLENDSVAVGKSAHRLKSAARELGSKRVSELCEALEAAAKSSQIKIFSSLFSELQNELTKVWAEIDIVRANLNQQLEIKTA